jgi:uncharacterized iron-regulated membrane protein
MGKSFRRVIFWSHLVCGVSAGLVILLMSLTGVLLTYEKQMIVWAETRSYQLSPGREEQSLSPEELLKRVREVESGRPVTFLARADRTLPVAIGLDDGRTLQVDPYAGAVLGEGAPAVRRFFRFVTSWHRWLGNEGAGRATGKAITGACNLAFLFVIVSGFYLWFPAQKTWSRFKSILWFQRGLPAKARDFNWHNVIGFWSLAPLFLLVLSATVISYPWASNLAYRVMGDQPPAPAPPPSPAAASRPTSGSPGADRAPVEGRIDGPWRVAAAHTEGWRTLSLRLPDKPEVPLVFTIDHGTGGQPQKRATLTLAPGTGEVLKWEPFSSFSRGRKFRTFLRFAHTGEVGGIAGQTLAGVVTFGTLFLGWTGFALAWRRFGAWRKRS